LSIFDLPASARLMDQLRRGTIAGGDFENLVWNLLLRDTFNSGGLEVTPYYLNGKQAPSTIFRFTNFLAVDDLNSIPVSLRTGSTLVRCLNDFPRWDCASAGAFFQISRSTFTDHNVGYADISKSFEADSEVQRALEVLTGQAVTTIKISGTGNFEVAPICPKFFYITLTKPNHPRTYLKYKEKLVIVASEVWCK
jgi:hypothetical protein